MVQKLEIPDKQSDLSQSTLDFFRETDEEINSQERTSQYQRLALSTLTMCCTCDGN